MIAAPIEWVVVTEIKAKGENRAIIIRLFRPKIVLNNSIWLIFAFLILRFKYCFTLSKGTFWKIKPEIKNIIKTYRSKEFSVSTGVWFGAISFKTKLNKRIPKLKKDFKEKSYIKILRRNRGGWMYSVR